MNEKRTSNAKKRNCKSSTNSSAGENVILLICILAVICVVYMIWRWTKLMNFFYIMLGLIVGFAVLQITSLSIFKPAFRNSMVKREPQISMITGPVGFVYALFVFCTSTNKKIEITPNIAAIGAAVGTLLWLLKSTVKYWRKVQEQENESEERENKGASTNSKQ